MTAFDVYRPTKTGKSLRWIDTVFYSDSAKVTRDEVRRSLINHDGYPSDIVVRKSRKFLKKNWQKVHKTGCRR